MHYNIAPIIEEKASILTSKISPPGPGAYNEVASSDVLLRKPLGTIPKEERFKVNISQ
jgi:hypothetical protein